MGRMSVVATMDNAMLMAIVALVRFMGSSLDLV